MWSAVEYYICHTLNNVLYILYKTILIQYNNTKLAKHRKVLRIKNAIEFLLSHMLQILYIIQDNVWYLKGLTLVSYFRATVFGR